ncbi:MAG: MAPEG family protein [Gammaproteobacteria bacterium]
MSVAITAIYASVLSVVYVVLSYRVAKCRMRFAVGLGTAHNVELERAVRIHGNFAEYVPLALLLLAFYEVGGGAWWAVHTAGAWLVVARLLHAVGLTRSSGRSTGRFAGVVMTWTLLLALAVGNLVLSLR